jgi:drug/metabolite transporter (DMT)-like permease
VIGGKNEKALAGARLADALLLFNTVIWGSTFVLVKAALGGVSPVLYLALRFALAAAVLALFFRRPLAERWSWREAGAGAAAGSFLFSGYWFQTMGLQYTSAPKSAFLTGLTSVMVPLLAALVYKIRPQVFEIVGVVVATGGLSLMTLEGVTGSISRGDLLTLLGTIGFALYIVTLGHFSRQMSFEVLSVSQIASAAILGLSLFWWVETPRVDWRPAVVWAIVVGGLLATALAFTVQAWAQQYTTSTRTALIYMLEPVFAWVTSYILVNEGLSGRAAVGALLILGGVVLVEMKPLNSRLHPSQ